MIELISWQAWSVTGSIAALLILFITILLWLLPFPSGSIREQFGTVDDRVDLRARLGAAPPFVRYRIAMLRFSNWLSAWFGPPWSSQAFERCVAIAFVFPVALFLVATVLSGYKHSQLSAGELLLFVFGLAVVSIALRGLSYFIYWLARRMWHSIGGDSELAEIVTRILLGAFAVVFAFAIAFAVASSLAGQAGAGTVMFAILGGFAFAFAFALAYTVAGKWAAIIAVVIVTVLALTMAKQFAFFLLLFFAILPVLNALMDWGSWAVTRYLLGYIHRAPDGPQGVALVVVLLLVNVATGLVFVMALAVLLPLGLEFTDLILSIFGHAPFDWRKVAAQAVSAPWDEGLFVTGMLLTPLIPSIAHITLGLGGLAAAYTRGAGSAISAISDHPDSEPAEPEIRRAVKILTWARLWYIPAFAASIGVYALVWGLFQAAQVPIGEFLYRLALCATAWGGSCAWLGGS